MAWRGAWRFMRFHPPSAVRGWCVGLGVECPGGRPAHQHSSLRQSGAPVNGSARLRLDWRCLAVRPIAGSRRCRGPIALALAMAPGAADQRPVQLARGSLRALWCLFWGFRRAVFWLAQAPALADCASGFPVARWSANCPPGLSGFAPGSTVDGFADAIRRLRRGAAGFPDRHRPPGFAPAARAAENYQLAGVSRLGRDCPAGCARTSAALAPGCSDCRWRVARRWWRRAGRAGVGRPGARGWLSGPELAPVIYPQATWPRET